MELINTGSLRTNIVQIILIPGINKNNYTWAIINAPKTLIFNAGRNKANKT